jgi:hypothetical protein
MCMCQNIFKLWHLNMTKKILDYSFKEHLKTVILKCHNEEGGGAPKKCHGYLKGPYSVDSS